MDVLSADSLDSIMLRIQDYRRLLKLIELKSVEDGVCALPHKVMANFLDTTHGQINNWIDKLLEFDILEKVDSSYTYKIKNPEIEPTLLDYVMDLLNLLKENPQLSFSLQAKELNITLTELELLFGLVLQIKSDLG